MKKNYRKKSALFITLIIVVILTSGFFISKKLLKPKDSVEVAELEIKLPTGKSSVKIGASQTALIKALGQPKQIGPYSSQAHYKQGTVLNYNGAKFYFVHNKLTNFEITSHKYKVGLASTHKYNSIGNTQAQLPKFKIQNKTALLDVTSDDSTTDQFLEYDLSDSGKLTKITYSDY
ncbi:hypothetical protein [Mucilaginibacter paludis]|uniref:Uncharacterized protein n=1 Tax=Mucilaginibacter paludis DSM 18603 TaxID=714943 RepID=H1Y5Z5_9SPHI|nr:hypothetical protein [Mucilaginibacter paludis]EHQ30417.1 hypothetical protein Mucpa_6363 [Mucilaginibacter paludis DSM 18603]